MTSLLNMTTHITNEKYDSRFPDVPVILIPRVFYFTVKRSSPYYKTNIRSLWRYVATTHCPLYDNLEQFTEVGSLVVDIYRGASGEFNVHH